jgi:hypothetical protein
LRAAAISPRTPAAEAAAAPTRVAALSRQAARPTPAQVGATPVALLSGAAVGPAPGPVAPQLREVQATLPPVSPAAVGSTPGMRQLARALHVTPSRAGLAFRVWCGWATVAPHVNHAPELARSSAAHPARISRRRQVSVVASASWIRSRAATDGCGTKSFGNSSSTNTARLPARLIRTAPSLPK